MNKKLNLGRTALLPLVSLALTLQFCKPSQTTASSSGERPPETVPATSTPSPSPAAGTLSYEKDIRPLMLKSCTPCHFPQYGHKKMLNTHEATKDNIKEIVTRVMLPSSDEKSMPFQGKRPRWTTDELKLVTDWIGQGMPR